MKKTIKVTVDKSHLLTLGERMYSASIELIRGDKVYPNAPELCDNRDNDCDRETDEDFPNKGKPCMVGVGECQNTGLGVCSIVEPTKLLCSVAPKQPQTEVCDGQDNDCDGKTDEDLPDITCGIGICSDVYERRFKVSNDFRPAEV